MQLLLARTKKRPSHFVERLDGQLIRHRKPSLRPHHANDVSIVESATIPPVVQSLQRQGLQMSRAVKIGVAVAAIAPMLGILVVIVLFGGMKEFTPSPVATREIQLPNHGSLIIDGQRRGRSEHGFSQRVGYRAPESTAIEWFGEVSDGVEPQVYQAGPLVVVIDPPAAQLYVRTHRAHAGIDRAQDTAVASSIDHAISPTLEEKWKSLALIFPNDLGPFPISYYAEKNGLTEEEICRINELGGKRERKYPTTYIQSFDPDTRDMKCSYQVDNMSSWPLHLRLSEDGTHLVLIEIGGPTH